MKNLAKYSVKRPVTVVMAIIMALLLGVVSFMNLTVDLLPNLNIPITIVYTPYFGASSPEVEMMVTDPLEASLASVSNIKNINSTSSDNFSMIVLEFEEGSNMDSLALDVRENVDMVSGFMPDGVGDSIIIKADPSMIPVLVFSLTNGDETIEESTIYYQNEILPRLERIPGVASIDVTGAAENEVYIVVDETKLAAENAKLQVLEDNINSQIQLALNGILVSNGAASYDDLDPTNKAMYDALAANLVELPEIDTSMIDMILAGQNFNMPSGFMDIGGVQYLVRVGDDIVGLDGIRETIIYPIPFPDTPSITLEDVANVDLVNINENTYNKVNGKDAISFSVQKQSTYATTDVVNALMEELNLLQSENENLELTIILDQGQYINRSVNTVGFNLIIGAVLAILVLWVFLRNFKVTLTIAIAIPVSVIGTFVLIYFSGITLNMISMGGLALGVGMLVDNSIVVLENIYRLRNEGLDAEEASIEGTKQVVGAITASTLTTVSVFLPIVFMEGMIAEIFMEMALTITFSLLASLIISITVVPAVSASLLVKNKEASDGKIMNSLKVIYEKVILSGKIKLAVFVTVITLFVGSLLALSNGVLGFVYFPEQDAGEFTVNINYENGTTHEEMETQTDAFYQLISDMDEADTIRATVGSGMGFGPFSGSADATIDVALKDSRTKSTAELVQEVRDLALVNGYDVSVSESGSSMMAMGTTGGISISVKGADLDKLEEIAADVADIIASVEGTTEVDNGINKGSQEIKITVNKEDAITNGLTVASVFLALFEELSTDVITRVNVDGSEIDVKQPSTKEWTFEDLENFTITNTMGAEVLLKDIAEIKDTFGFTSINHENQSRIITVEAQVEDGYNIGKVSTQISDLLDEYEVQSGYLVEMGGEAEEFMDAAVVLIQALLLAVLLVYMVMASQFQSYKFPFIVMFTLPLAITGGFIALYIAQMPLSVVALIGMIILAGIVVNNGIVLVDYINQLMDKGYQLDDAIVEAGKTRMRPIFMTALTTILALSPLAVGFGENAELMQPMAVTAIGGLIFATVLTLVVVPTLYKVFYRVTFRKLYMLPKRLIFRNKEKVVDVNE